MEATQLVTRQGYSIVEASRSLVIGETSYCTTPYADTKSVVYDLAPTRADERARSFHEGWAGKQICDQYSGYKASFSHGIPEIGFMAHPRRNFSKLHETSKSKLAATALEQIGKLYEVERQAKILHVYQRYIVRQQNARPTADALHTWFIAGWQKVPDGTARAKTIDFSLKTWSTQPSYLDDGALPIGNNQVENQIWPWALDSSNWLFARSLRSDHRAAAVLSLIQLAKLSGHDPHAYLRDVLTRLPTHKASVINELMPHKRQPQSAGKI